MDLIDTVREVDFEFGIGDPTFFGWFTVVAYLVAAGLSVANAWRAHTGSSRTLRRLWWTLAVLQLLLAVNKQLDVQSYFTAVGRAVAREQGWYESRGSVQILFVFGVALASLATIGLISWALRDVFREQWLTLVGIVAILGFVLIRASSFHYIDVLIDLELAGLRMNWVIELGAIGVFCAAAIAQLRRPQPDAGTIAAAPVDRRIRFAIVAMLGVGGIIGVGALAVADRASPDTHLDPERRQYEGVVPVYALPTGVTTFAEPFTGAPASPTPWPETSMDITVRSRDFKTWRRLDEMDAAFGANCESPPATHTISAYADAVFQCDNQLITAINATGFGVVYLTPDHLLHLDDGGTIRWQMSTTRTARTDWISIWISPYDEHLQLPLPSGLSNLSGPPKNGLYLEMGITANNFVGRQFVDHVGVELAVENPDAYDTVLDPSRTTLTTFEIELSPTHIRMGLPEHDLWWIDTDLPARLDWTDAVVQFAHASTNASRGCEGRDNCGPNSWHWDDITLEPAVPFTILQGRQDYIDVSQTPEVVFDRPAPEDAHLRFVGTGRDLEVSVDGGFTWAPAEVQIQESFDQNGFDSFWHPVPAGTWYARFRADNQSDWHIRDISIWSPYVESE